MSFFHQIKETKLRKTFESEKCTEILEPCGENLCGNSTPEPILIFHFLWDCSSLYIHIKLSQLNNIQFGDFIKSIKLALTLLANGHQ